MIAITTSSSISVNARRDAMTPASFDAASNFRCLDTCPTIITLLPDLDKAVRGRGGLGMSDPFRPRDCAKRLGALASPERLKIIRFLSGGPHNVSEIAAALKTAPVNVAHHMSRLRLAGLVRNQKKGRFVFYSLVPGLFQDGGVGVDYLNLGCCRLEMPRRASPGR